ncbi:MAG: hypothetical protein ACJAVN_000324 [Roseivirga sp.]|jgi:hypothetical protein
MILYLYLQIKPLKTVKFSSDFSEELRALGLDITQVDLDSHSESFTVSKSTELIVHAEKLILHLDIDANEDIGALIPVFEKLRRFNQLALCLQEGEHESLAKMMKLLKIKPIKLKKTGSGIDYIKDFLST